MIAARPARSVDVAAAQLIAREAGACVQFGDGGLGAAKLDLVARFEIAAALDEEMLGTLREVQRERRASGRERRRAIVDWGLAERTAAAMLALPRGGWVEPGVHGRRRSSAPRLQGDRGRGRLRRPRRRPAAPPVAELIDRASGRATRSPRCATRPRRWRRRLADQIDAPGPLGPALRRAAGAALGIEVGVRRRVRGRARPRPARLRPLRRRAPAAAAVRRREPRARPVGSRRRRRHLPALGRAARGHARGPVRPASPGWQSHLRALAARADRGRDRRPRRGLARPARPRAAALARASSCGRCCAASSPGCSPIPKRRARLDRLQATMSVIEGHAEHVMDAAADELGGELARASPSPRRSAARGAAGSAT